MFDCEEKFEEICFLCLILSDQEERYKVRLSLKDISGDISFNTVNGFYSGLAIEDRSDRGWERDRRYVMFSFEPYIDFEIFFAAGSVEMSEDI